jgi:CIC family chloride channel protein
MRLRRESINYLIFVIPVAIFAGLVGSGVVTLFNIALAAVQRIVLLMPGVQYLAPAAGALVVGFLILRFVPGAGGEGVPPYIISVNMSCGKQGIIESVLRFPASVLTLGSFGSGGIVGPLIGIGSGLTSFAAERILSPLGIRREGGMRTAAICGASAAIGSIFHAPIAGGMLAAEVLRRENLRYADLFPSILAGAVGTTASIHIFGQNAVFEVSAPKTPADYHSLLWLPVVAAVAGGVGMAFVNLFEVIARLLSKAQKTQPARALIAAIAICVLFYFTGREALGISMGLFSKIADGRLDTIAHLPFPAGGAAFTLGLMLLVKLASTSITVGGGMSAGFTGPLVILGVGSGALMGIAVGIEPGDPSYYVFLACGLSAILGAAMNVPIAAVLLSIELFGAGYAIPAVTGGIVSFLIYKTRSVYSIRRPEYLSEPCADESQNLHER